MNETPIPENRFKKLLNREPTDGLMVMRFVALHGNLFYNNETQHVATRYNNHTEWTKGVTKNTDDVIKVIDLSVQRHGPSALIDMIISLYIGTIDMSYAIGSSAAIIVSQTRIAIIYPNDRSDDVFNTYYDRMDKYPKHHMVVGMITALNAFHNLGFIHNDVKAENFIINPMGEIKIIDYGTVTVHDPYVHHSDYICGTMEYTHPLCWVYRRSSKWTDIFSLVKNILCLMTGGQLAPVLDDDGVFIIKRNRQAYMDHLDVTKKDMTTCIDHLFERNLIDHLKILSLADRKLFGVMINNFNTSSYLVQLQNMLME